MSGHLDMVDLFCHESTSGEPKVRTARLMIAEILHSRRSVVVGNEKFHAAMEMAPYAGTAQPAMSSHFKSGS